MSRAGMQPDPHPPQRGPGIRPAAGQYRRTRPMLHASSAAHPLPTASRANGKATPLPQVDSIATLSQQLFRQLAQCRRVGEQMTMLWVELELLAQPGSDHGASEVLDENLLQAAGQRLRHRVRSTDEVVQVGTQGFAVLLKVAGAAEARLVEQRLKQALTGAYGLGEQRLYLGVSMGLAVFPECGRTGAELAQAACRDLAIKQGA